MTPEEYQQWVLARIWQTGTGSRAISQAYGLALAEPAIAEIDLPIWDSSAMDGYAVRAQDIAEATAAQPAALRVLDEVAAGDGSDPDLQTGGAVRIMTGAPVPSAASAVVPIELTEGFMREAPASDAWIGPEVRVIRAVGAGANIRRRGEDVGRGDTIAHAGDTLNAARLSALAAAGVGSVQVHDAPRIAVVSTGSELRAAGTELRRGEIHESNSVLLAGLLREAGFEATTIEHCVDDAESLKVRLAHLAAKHDAVITTGGVGPGKYDVVRIALEDEPEVRSVRVSVRPGQPQCSGRHSAGGFMFGLPGNPVSAAVSFELFVRPALRQMAGHSRLHRRSLVATAATDWPGKQGSFQVLPVTITSTPDGLVCAPSVSPTGVSHAVGRYGATDGYALVEADRGGVQAGEIVHIIETGIL